MRFLAIDLGNKRTGLAVGDDQTNLVTPLHAVECPAGLCGGEALLDLLAKAADDAVGLASRFELVVGLPLNMDGSEGPRAAIARDFARRIGQRLDRTVHLHDERLTTADADWSMARTGLTRGQKKERRDALAAASLLRDFLASRHATTHRPPDDTNPTA